MSESSLSQNDFYELKHVRTLKDNPSKFLQKKKQTQFYLNQVMLDKEYIKTDLSCECSECGKCSQFSETIKKQYPFCETRWQKRKRIFKRFKAATNAIIFILQQISFQQLLFDKSTISYKVEAIKKFRKRMHILKAVRNLTTLKKSQISAPTHLQQQPLISIPHSRQSQRIKTTPDEETFFHHVINSAREPRKSQVSIYMNQMLKNVIPKSDVHLKPLSYLNQKQIKQNNAKSISQASFSHHNYSQVTSNPQKCPTVHLEQIVNNQYKMNNKDLLKLIDSLKVRHRIIRCKK